jgi:hypothetical protein
VIWAAIEDVSKHGKPPLAERPTQLRVDDVLLLEQLDRDGVFAVRVAMTKKGTPAGSFTSCATRDAGSGRSVTLNAGSEPTAGTVTSPPTATDVSRTRGALSSPSIHRRQRSA